VLLVDDDPMDVGLAVAALREAGVEQRVAVVDGGAAALDYLFGRGRYADRLAHPLPRLVLLDWTMPDVSGADVLRQLKATPALRRIPVVVLASSGCPEECDRSYDEGANSCLVKPISFSGFAETARRIRDYWLRLNADPPTD
jgi:CheY-like chemotaxis protein